MVLALWMERFPDEPEREKADPKRKVGAVLVLPTDMVYAVDCTRNGVHGVARLFMAHQDVLQDCKVFVSRKPCSLCTKLLVQSKVKRVFYLPIEPEYSPQYRENKDGKVINWTKKEKRDFKDETSRVDDLFKESAIGQSVFVPKVGPEVVENAEKKIETPKKIREPHGGLLDRQLDDNSQS